uniref:Uncharacterized protein n=1 Tax=Tanacetum cinerariifolium TaxID=118510 RepID=A0A699JVZ8_TANCI|nr:hypothetical protein [Tanacetum cinerariifolium]GFA72008.1 hypothetical protein [Tanacetum cinerariifolium]
MVMLSCLKEDEMIKTRLKTPLLDQTKGRKEENLIKMLSPLNIQEQPSHIVEESGMQEDQEFITRDNDEQPIEKEKYDYGHLEEIEVRRDDQQLYTFKEGDFKRLRLQDIKDMLLLLVQQKLTNLTIDEWYDLNVALRMFTRRIVIQRRVKDLKLGVEIYRNKLNLTTHDTFRSNLRNKTTYTSYSDPHGIIYVDQFKRKRLMRTDELHKFSDDKKRARVMVQEIDNQLYQRRLMWNLEMFVGGRIYGKDLRLLERII